MSVGLAIALTCCGYTIRQEVQGGFAIAEHPLAGVQVALVRDAIADSCEGERLIVTTDGNGRFATKRSATVGTVAVVVQHDVLCVNEDGTWRIVWAGIYGPAPVAMHFTCSKNAGGEWSCDMNGMESLPNPRLQRTALRAAAEPPSR
jgi:hypothetical protein